MGSQILSKLFIKSFRITANALVNAGGTDTTVTTEYKTGAQVNKDNDGNYISNTY